MGSHVPTHRLVPYCGSGRILSTSPRNVKDTTEENQIPTCSAYHHHHKPSSDSSHSFKPRKKHEKELQGHKTTDCSESPIFLEGTPLLMRGFTTQCPLEYMRNLRCLHEDMAECESPFKKTAPCQS